jgi:hypothetical protein
MHTKGAPVVEANVKCKLGACGRITELNRDTDLLEFAGLHINRSLGDADKKTP